MYIFVLYIYISGIWAAVAPCSCYCFGLFGSEADDNSNSHRQQSTLVYGFGWFGLVSRWCLAVCMVEFHLSLGHQKATPDTSSGAKIPFLGP